MKNTSNNGALVLIFCCVFFLCFFSVSLCVVSLSVCVVSEIQLGAQCIISMVGTRTTIKDPQGTHRQTKKNRTTQEPMTLHCERTNNRNEEKRRTKRRRKTNSAEQIENQGGTHWSEVERCGISSALACPTLIVAVFLLCFLCLCVWVYRCCERERIFLWLFLLVIWCCSSKLCIKSKSIWRFSNNTHTHT